MHLLGHARDDWVRLREEHAREERGPRRRRADERQFPRAAGLPAGDARLDAAVRAEDELHARARRRRAPGLVARRAVQTLVVEREGLALGPGRRDEAPQPQVRDRVGPLARRRHRAVVRRLLRGPDVLAGHAGDVADDAQRPRAHVLREGGADPGERVVVDADDAAGERVVARAVDARAPAASPATGPRCVLPLETIKPPRGLPRSLPGEGAPKLGAGEPINIAQPASERQCRERF